MKKDKKTWPRISIVLANEADENLKPVHYPSVILRPRVISPNNSPFCLAPIRYYRNFSFSRYFRPFPTLFDLGGFFLSVFSFLFFILLIYQKPSLAIAFLAERSSSRTTEKWFYRDWTSHPSPGAWGSWTDRPNPFFLTLSPSLHDSSAPRDEHTSPHTARCCCSVGNRVPRDSLALYHWTDRLPTKAPPRYISPCGP